MSSSSLKPGLPITTLEEFISTVRTLNNRSIYTSKPRTRFFSDVSLPDPFVEYDGKPISRLYLSSHDSVSQYDWYQSFTLCFCDDLSWPPSAEGCDGFVSRDGKGKGLKEIRGYGYLDFRACQRVYYTALIEEFVLSLVEDEQKEEGGDDVDWKSDQVTLVDMEKSFGAKLVDAIKQRSHTSTKTTKKGKEEEEGGEGDQKSYTFNLKIKMRPETSLANYKNSRFGYYSLEESYELRRTYNIRFNVEKGLWPNSNGYTHVDYLVKVDTDKSPFPQEAREAVRYEEGVWEKVFFANINEPFVDEDRGVYLR